MELDRLEGTFYDYMHQLGQASPEWTHDVLSYYVPMFTNCHRVLDIGCGEGEFIQLLQDEGVEVVGIDSDARMVELCRRKGLEVVQADLFDYLPLHERHFDGIFGSNLIEHLSAQEATRFMKAAYCALSPGGLLLLSTPNPASLIVHLYEFWRDATHVRLYSRPLLEFLFHWVGLEQIESGENPRTSWTPSDAMQRVPQLLKELSTVKNTAAPDEVRRQTADEVPPQAPESATQKLISPLRRRILSWRRALGRLVVQSILFEEFGARDRRLDRSLNRLDGHLGRLDGHLGRLDGQISRIQQIEQTMYHSQEQILSRPREVFAIGIRPLPDPGD